MPASFVRRDGDDDHSAAAPPAPPNLPSLLLGLRQHQSSSKAVPTLSASPSSALRPSSPAASHSPRRTSSTTGSLSRSLSVASLVPPSLSLATSTVTTTGDVDEGDGDSDEDDVSDASSGFEGLLQRVGAVPLPPRIPSLKGKERAIERTEQESLAEGEGQSAEPVNDDDDDDDDEEEDGQVDLIEREEGQPDPRDMLRAQLRRSESHGRGMGSSGLERERRARSALSRQVSATTVAVNAGTESTSVAGTDPPPASARYPPRRYYILSSAGKLVYTTQSDEEEASGHVGVMQAIISIFADERDKIRYVDAGGTRIAFLLKAPLYLVCASEWGEPESVLRSHLDYLYLQVLSIITLAQLSSIFSKRSNFDLRRLMEGTEGFFTTLVGRLQTSLAILTSSIEVYRIDVGVRSEVSKALVPVKSKATASNLSLLYALVISHGRLVTLIRPASHSIHPTDLHLLLSTISSSSSFREPDADSWIPICLPRFNNRGFLYAYISFVSDKTGVVLISSERDKFEGVKSYADDVKARLRSGGLLHRLEMERSRQVYSLGELAIAGLRHFLYKSKTHVQVTHPAYEGDYEDEDNKLRLITLYQRVHDAIHIKAHSSASGASAPRPPAKLVYSRTEHEAVLGWTTNKFELYLAVSPLMPRTAVVSAARAVTRWIRPEELFLTGALSF